MYIKKNCLYVFILFLFTTSIGMAQSGIISGVLEDSSGPIKGSTNGTQTDFDGNYRSSRQRDFHPKPLTEPCLKVSPHTALVIQIYAIQFI